MSHICIICAIRQETGPILKLFPSTRIASFTDLPAWRFQAFGHSVTLIQSGIGASKAAKAVAAAVEFAPEVIVSAGFCGALTDEIAAGELFLAEKLYTFSLGIIDAAITPDQELNNLIGTRLNKAIFITTAGIIEKRHLYPLLPDPEATSMIEMESSAVAAACRTNGVRFIAIRSVSDTAAQDPARLFQLISDTDYNISIIRAALTLIKKPSLLPEYLQLHRNIVIAGKSLSEAIAFTLENI